MKPARDEGGNGLEDVDAQLQQLLDAYGAFLRAAVRRFCPSSLGIAADEVEQDARVRLWHALKRERNITDLASYLYKVAATAAIDAARRVRARLETSIDAAAGPGLPSVVDNMRTASRSPEQLAGDVRDRSTAELMTRFYRSMLRDGLPPAAALRAAQASMWRDALWSAPAHWAGFILEGDWRTKN